MILYAPGFEVCRRPDGSVEMLDGLPASLTDAQRAAAETALVARAVGRTAEQLTTVAADVLAEVAPAAVSSEA